MKHWNENSNEIDLTKMPILRRVIHNISLIHRPKKKKMDSKVKKTLQYFYRLFLKHSSSIPYIELTKRKNRMKLPWKYSTIGINNIHRVRTRGWNWYANCRTNSEHYVNSKETMIFKLQLAILFFIHKFIETIFITIITNIKWLLFQSQCRSIDLAWL